MSPPLTLPPALSFYRYMKTSIKIKISFFFLFFIIFTSGSASAYTLKSTTKGERIRWGQDVIAMRVDPQLDQIVDLTTTTAASVMASEAWRGYTNVPDLIIKKGSPDPVGYSDSDHPTNGIYIYDPWPYEPEKLAVTVTTFEEATGRLLDADVLVNPDVHFELFVNENNDNGDEAYDFAAILAHEFGHVLGLGESYEDPMATMWPQIARGETHKRSLSDDDESGIVAAYSGPAPEDAMGCGKTSIVRNRTRTPAVLYSILLISCIYWVYRLRKTLKKRALPGIIACGSALCLFAPVNESSVSNDSSQRAKLVRSAPSASERIDASHPEAKKRLRRLTRGSVRVFLGKAIQKHTAIENGLFWSTYSVSDQNGNEVELRIPGGTIDGITQQVGETSAPVSGKDLVVAPRADGTAGWAYYKDESIHGGWLGHGPAIDYNL